ncbi:MAG: Gfo/Idh/MocA family oxidoreductase [Oscillospiraceae bacterium]|nr:Gfo/Idh/MocA family oxidoreductase [Oscillospiraceae bacterium]
MFNFAILTAGNIAGQMAATVCKMPEVHAYAIAARSESRAQDMATQYGFEKAYGSYEALFADPNVDIIYVASPHSHHYAHAKAALLAGKHVLCEKAFTTAAPLGEELFRLANEKNRVILDATWTRFMPFAKALAGMIESGEIGTALTLEASFGFPLDTVPRMAEPALAGGALLDLGIYPLTFASIAFGPDFKAVQSLCQKTEKGVDAYSAITVQWQNGRIGTLTCNMQAALANCGIIYGTNGKITVPDFWHANRIIVQPTGQAPREHVFLHDISGYEYEVRELCRLITASEAESPLLPHSETLRILSVMDALRAEWGVRYPFE